MSHTVTQVRASYITYLDYCTGLLIDPPVLEFPYRCPLPYSHPHSLIFLSPNSNQTPNKTCHDLYLWGKKTLKEQLPIYNSQSPSKTPKSFHLPHLVLASYPQCSPYSSFTHLFLNSSAFLLWSPFASHSFWYTLIWLILQVQLFQALIFLSMSLLATLNSAVVSKGVLLGKWR